MKATISTVTRNATASNAHFNDDPSDAIWILTSSFIIFTMQSGFGLLEAGMVSAKNESNIMVKNAVDVIFGGFAYWLYGFAFSFGTTNPKYANGFTGLGQFVVDASEAEMGHVYAKYIFQLSFATTATTIVSGAMAERTNLKAYMLYSFFNTLSYCFPAHWMWDDNGFLKKLGAIDIAGCGPIHLVGGVSALVATLMLKPRHGRFKGSKSPSMSSPTNVMLGTFMLWWGWLGFNCGSTFGISGHKWKLASRAAVVTINGSIGGSAFAIFYSYTLSRKHRGKLNVPKLANGILGGLVSITAFCAISKPWEALLVGVIGGVISTAGDDLIEYVGIDDPVGCISVHLFCSIWGLIAVALFAERDRLGGFNHQNGLFRGGEWKFLASQLAAIASMAAWAVVTSFITLWVINKFIKLRVSLEEELQGADFWEHGITTRCPLIEPEERNHDESKRDRDQRQSKISRKTGLCIDLSFVNETVEEEDQCANCRDNLQENSKNEISKANQKKTRRVSVKAKDPDISVDSFNIKRTTSSNKS